MNQRTHRARRRTILAMVAVALVMLTLSACGVGGDDDEPTATAEVVDESTVDDSTEAVGSEQASPAVAGDVPGAGTPLAPAMPGGATPTPPIVVSTPAIEIPNVTPEAAGSPTPAVSGGAQGDGTGGAAANAGSQAPATPGLGDAGSATTVSSCDVASFPPLQVELPNLVTTSDVNFRSGPGTDCEPIGEPLGAGVVVEVVSEPVQREGEDSIWVAVSIDGVQGWLTTDFLEPVAE